MIGSGQTNGSMSLALLQGMGPRSFRAILRRCLGGLCLLGLVGCSPQVPGFSDVLTAFDGLPKKDVPPTSQEPATSVRIFLDCSKGMLGFLPKQPLGYQSNYVRILETLSTHLPSAGFSTAWYCADTTKSLVTLQTTGLAQPGEYSSAPDSLGNLLGALENAPRSDRPVIDVLIGDWATPETGESSATRAAAFQRIADEKRQLLQWGFRSGFYGNYRSASPVCRGATLMLRQGQTLPGLGRPFYMLVPAPDPGSLQHLVGSLADVLHPAAEYYWSNPPIQLTKLNISKLPSGVISQRSVQEYLSSQFPKRVYSAFTVSHGNSFKITFNWPARVELASKIVDQVDGILDWQNGRPEKIDQLDVAVQTSHEAGTGQLSYTVTFPGQKGSKWKVYRILLSVRGDDGEDTPMPTWITDWSTSSDCEIASANHTLNLTDVGYALSEKFLKDKPFLEHFIAVRRD